MAWDTNIKGLPPTAEQRAANEAAAAMEQNRAREDARTAAIANAISDGFGQLADAILKAAGIHVLTADPAERLSPYLPTPAPGRMGPLICPECFAEFTAPDPETAVENLEAHRRTHRQPIVEIWCPVCDEPVTLPHEHLAPTPT